jgi:MurNAc alpha-1-phosphate uridylyltransferase
MNAMILAAGRGERMRPLTDTCPKPLLEVRGVPLIEYHLDALARVGIRRVVVNLSWLGGQIRDALGDGTRFGLRIDYSEEAEALETAGGIVQALDLLDERFIVTNGDVFTDFDFARLLDQSAAAHLVMVPNPGFNPQGDYAIEQGLLSNRGVQRHTFSGIAAYQKSFFAGLAPGRRPLAPLLTAGADQQTISAELHQGLWSDVGTPQRLARLNRD